MHLDCGIDHTEHVPGELNVIYDGLSRDLPAEAVGLPPSLQLPITFTHPYAAILRLCDPTQPMTSPDDHITLSAAVISLLHDAL